MLRGTRFEILTFQFSAVGGGSGGGGGSGVGIDSVRGIRDDFLLILNSFFMFI